MVVLFLMWQVVICNELDVLLHDLSIISNVAIDHFDIKSLFWIVDI
jgi:hypothetical protein